MKSSFEFQTEDTGRVLEVEFSVEMIHLMECLCKTA